MRLETLKYLLEIERCGSINKASQTLFLSHSTLSYILQSTEEELGYPLFQRSKQGVFPTLRGQEVLHDCRVIVDIMSHWEDHDRPEMHAVRGNVQIISIPVFSRIFGMELVMHLQQEYPDLSIRFEERKLFTLEELLPQLKRSSARVLIASLNSTERAAFDQTFVQEADWSYYWANVDALMLHVSAQNPLAQQDSVTLEDLKRLPPLFYPDSGGRFGYRGVLRYFASTHLYNISTAGQVIEAVADDRCVALASRLETRRSAVVQDGRVRCFTIQDFPMPMSYVLLHPSEPNMTAAEKVVVSEIVRRFREIAEQITGETGKP